MWGPLESTTNPLRFTGHFMRCPTLSAASAKDFTKIRYFRLYREKQNGTPRELTPYNLLDVPNNLYAVPKTTTVSSIKFHYDPISISGAIAINRCAAPGSYTPKCIHCNKTRCVRVEAASNTCTKFH